MALKQTREKWAKKKLQKQHRISQGGQKKKKTAAKKTIQEHRTQTRSNPGSSENTGKLSTAIARITLKFDEPFVGGEKTQHWGKQRPVPSHQH